MLNDNLPDLSKALPSMCCGNCKYFSPNEGNELSGVCKRHPPTVFCVTAQGKLGQPKTVPIAFWAPIDADKWCGEFESADMKRVKLDS